MARFFVGEEFPNFKPIKALCHMVHPALEGKIAAIQVAIAGATGEERDRLQKDLNYLLGLKKHCDESMDAGTGMTKSFYFTVAQAKLVGILS